MLSLSEITRVDLISWSDGPDSCRVQMIDGQRISLPAACLPDGDTLTRALADEGVAVNRR